MLDQVVFYYVLELFSSRCYFDFVGPYFDSKEFLWSKENPRHVRLRIKIKLACLASLSRLPDCCQTRLRTHRTIGFPRTIPFSLLSTTPPPFLAA
jgi:hypothetical protein